MRYGVEWCKCYSSIPGEMESSIRYVHVAAEEVRISEVKMMGCVVRPNKAILKEEVHFYLIVY